ncbi:MAG: hypothetical protein KAX99_04560 [Azonexus sp.]|nr:hypothetical protein [Azonexus sp.]
MKLFSLIALLFSLSAGAGEIPQSTFVRFNTVCATCHEGECSGRLSFQSGVSAALGHMQRHLGNVTDSEASDLFGLIKYTKERCAHYPVPGKIPNDDIWTAADLAAWRNLQAGAYFIPLGNIPAGKYRLRLSFNSPAQGRLKITDQRFEPVADEALCPESMQEVVFTVSTNPHYLTLHSQGELSGMVLKRDSR